MQIKKYKKNILDIDLKALLSHTLSVSLKLTAKMALESWRWMKSLKANFYSFFLLLKFYKNSIKIFGDQSNFSKPQWKQDNCYISTKLYKN